MHLADAFIQRDLKCIQAIHYLINMFVPWELNPQTFALLTQCSTAEPQKHQANSLKLLYVGENAQCTIWQIRQSVKTSNHWICHQRLWFPQKQSKSSYVHLGLHMSESTWKIYFFNASWVWETKSMGQFLSDFVAGFEIFKWVFAIWSFWEYFQYFSISPVKKIGIVVSDARNSCLEV